ncbi:ABC transporter substrate-binding protein [Virgibacillus siamensis]|uniref:ABC transporter substrate-binding protein n=1 Tax=Virgibacillus siamensis TaxID=480071 RepID=UPI00098656CC|nr:ABC transporter substrate-binding protein [Virgibacillus siamensis]
MKKKGCTMLLLFLLVVFISGCSNLAVGSSNSDKIELDYWTLFGGGDAEFMKEIVQKFNSTHPDIKVNYIQLPFDDYYTKLVTGIAAGKAPDVAVSHISRLPQLVELGVVSSLNTAAQKQGIQWDKFNQNILEASIMNGNHYAVPIDTHPIAFYYNKKYLRKAGLLNEQGKPIIEETPEGFVNFLIKLKKELPEDIAPLSFATTGIDPYRLWWSYYHQLGADGVVSDDLSSADLELQKAVKAAKYMKDLYYKHEVIPLHITDFYRTFQSGNAASLITGVWSTGIWEGTEDLEFGVIPVPAIFGKRAVFGNSHTLFLPKHEKADTEKRKAALTFARFVAENGQIWAKAGHIPAKQTVYEKEAFKELPHRSDYVQIADHVAFQKPSVANGTIETILTRNLDTVLNGSKSAEKAFKKAEREIEELLQNSLLTPDE